MTSHLATPTVTEREPVLIIGLISTAVAAVIALLVAFGIDLSSGQQVAILGVIAGVGPLAAAVIARTKVIPVATVVAVVSPDGTVTAGPASPLPTGTPIAT